MGFESVLIGTTLALFAVWFVAKTLKSVYRPMPDGNPIALLDDVEWKTGDIVLYHCNPYINITTGGEWSHVGVVVVGESGVPRIFEITGTDHYCTAKPLRKELDKALAKKDNVVAFRRLSPPPSEAKVRAHVVASLKKRTHYEHVYWRAFYQRMFGAFFPLYVSGKDRLSQNSSVCSALVAELFQEVGAMQRTVHPLEVLPLDFGDHSSQPLPWEKGVRAGPLTFLRTLS